MHPDAGDPYITYDGEYYLFTFSTNDNITIKRSQNLTGNWDYAETKVVFTPNASEQCPYCTDVHPTIPIPSIVCANMQFVQAMGSGDTQSG
jgi:hypothetical protein